MYDTVDTVWETDNERVRLILDDYLEAANPREATNLGVMAAKGHRRYILGDDTDLVHEVDAAMRTIGPRLTARWLRIFHGATVVLPLGLIDHSGISMYVGSGAHPHDPGGWDSGLVGLIFDTPETREACGTPLDKIEDGLRAEVEVYDQYLRGEVYMAVHEVKHTWTRDDGVQRESWEHEDSVGGILGHDSAASTARYYFPEPVSA